MDSIFIFRVGGERFALPAGVVRECVEMGPVRHSVPVTDGGRLALTCVRGRWLPVVELASAMEGVARLDQTAGSSVLLVLGRDRGYLGLQVDGSEGIVALDSRLGYNRRSDDVVELDGELVRVIDPAVLLASRGETLGEEGGAMEEKRTTAEPLQVVAFGVGGEEFGVDVMKVQSVLTKPEIRVVPNTPDFVEGVVASRESVVPVIDMRKRFGIAEQEMGPGSSLLVVAAGDGRVGLVVDEVPGIAKIPQESVSPAPDFFKGLAGKYLEGIAEDQGRLIILLNLDEILSSRERIAIKKVLKAAGDEADKPKTGGKARKKTGARTKRKAKR